MTLAQVLINIIFGLVAYAITELIMARTSAEPTIKTIVAVVVGLLVFLLNVAARIGIV